MGLEFTQVTGRMQGWASRFRSFSPHTIALLFWFALGFLMLGLFFRMAFTVPVQVVDMSSGQAVIQSLDESVLRYIGTLRSDSWDFFFLDLSSLGSLAVVTMLCVMSVILFILVRDPAAAIHLVIVAVGGFYIAPWAKDLISRPRPDIIPKLIQVGGKSFPSGHAVTAAAIYLTLAILACRHFKSHRARVVRFLMAALVIAAVGFSRLDAGVHYPSDVLSGVFLGSAWALFMGALFSKQHFFKEN